METLKCIAQLNWSCLIDFGITELIGVLFVSVILVGFVYFFVALRIAHILIKGNRGAPGRGYGTQAADLYIELWYSDQVAGVKHIEYLGNGSRTQTKGTIAAEHLIPIKLAVQYFDVRQNRRMISAIKNYRNWIVFHAVKFDLIHKYDDDPKKFRQFKDSSIKHR